MECDQLSWRAHDEIRGTGWGRNCRLSLSSQRFRSQPGISTHIVSWLPTTVPSSGQTGKLFQANLEIWMCSWWQGLLVLLYTWHFCTRCLLLLRLSAVAIVYSYFCTVHCSIDREVTCRAINNIVTASNIDEEYSDVGKQRLEVPSRFKGMGRRLRSRTIHIN